MFELQFHSEQLSELLIGYSMRKVDTSTTLQLYKKKFIFRTGSSNDQLEKEAIGAIQ